jgi:flagellar hook-associated protein 1 FlgK
MSDLFSSLTSAARALDAQRFGMDVTGQNIANVNTPGYARRTIDLAEVAPYERTSAGGGVDVVDVRALRDRLLDRRLQQELPLERREAAMAEALSVVEAVIGRPGESLDTKLNAFFDSFSKLADSPTSGVARQEVLLQANSLATSFHDMADRLASAQRDSDQQVRSAVDQINTITARLAALNESSSKAASTGGVPALQDEQMSLVRQLGELVDVNVIDHGNGVVDVALGNGRPLVVGENPYALGVTSTPPSGFASITSGGADVTSQITGGRLGGMLQVRDVNLPNYMSQLDALAYNVATQVNTLHSAGYDQTGVAGGAFFAFSTAIVGSAGAAAALIVDPAVAADARRIAAAGIADAGDNQTARGIAALRDARILNSGTATFTDAWGQLVYTVGRDSKAAQDEQLSRSEIVRQVDALRDQVSGVSLDEEATNLLKFQRAYEANARFFRACDQALDTLLQNLP